MAKTHGGDFVQTIFHRAIVQADTNLHAVNAQHGFQRIGHNDHRLWDKTAR